jgi:hypothetical protein
MNSTHTVPNALPNHTGHPMKGITAQYQAGQRLGRNRIGFRHDPVSSSFRQCAISPSPVNESSLPHRGIPSRRVEGLRSTGDTGPWLVPTRQQH